MSAPMPDEPSLNPYSAPESPVRPEDVPSLADALDDADLDTLRRGHRWVERIVKGLGLLSLALGVLCLIGGAIASTGAILIGTGLIAATSARGEAITIGLIGLLDLGLGVLGCWLGRGLMGFRPGARWVCFAMAVLVGLL